MELWELVRLVSERYGKRLEEHRQAHSRACLLGQVTVQQFQYLQALRRGASPTVSYLSSYFGVRSPTATVIVKNLEDKGFLRRKPSEEDRRSTRLLLTEKGRAILGIQEQAFKALGDDIKASLSSNELETYARLTERVCVALEKLGPFRIMEVKDE